MIDNVALSAARRIALVGNHLPRHCGIATFTTDLAAALSAAAPGIECFVLAMNDAGRRHHYPEVVRFELGESDLPAYRRAADFLNVNEVDVVSVQHEYGIFGGKAGIHLVALLRELRMPVVTTLHTVLRSPDAFQRRAMAQVLALTERVVVMGEASVDVLATVHGVARDRIDVIPHGIPYIPWDARSKDKVGLQGRQVILTFGLLSPDKGIEHVIDAMPRILSRHPDAVYVVLGATHPHVKERQGELYRLSLERRAEELGVAASMIFHDRFVSQRELSEFLSAADVYVTPYLKEEQATSGTLAYAVGSGKAVVSTPYAYARELLADGRGVLVPWRDATAIADSITRLLSGEGRDEMCRRARAYGVDMGWPAVAARYLQSFDAARSSSVARRRSGFRVKTLAERPAELPAVDLSHLCLMTDDTGLLQHAILSLPRRGEGYCLDDNARGLRLMAHLEEAGASDPAVVHALSTRYLSFVEHAFDARSGRFRNFMSYARHWNDERGSEDAHGRALFALATVVGRSAHAGRQALARQLFLAALPVTVELTSPRAWASTQLGIAEYLRAYRGDSSVQAVRERLAEKLLDVFDRTTTAAWPWFEERVTYGNARLSQALLVTGDATSNEAMRAAGLRSLEWLWSLQCNADGDFSPIGSEGFYPRGGERAIVDQQPIEAAGMTSACLVAARVTGGAEWSDRARCAYRWFLGQNHLQTSLYDPSTGGCRDGLHADRVNENQGAESTLSFLFALSDMHALASEATLDTPVDEPPP